MVYPTQKVQKLLREYGLKRLKKGNRTPHEVWGDANGKKVQLAPRGNYVPINFLHETALELQSVGVRTLREFKADLRAVCCS